MLVKTKKFADLLQEAVATERSLRQLLYHRDSKPSPSAAMAEASRRAGTTPDRLTMLEQSLNERPLQLVERARGFVGKVVEAQREGKFRLSGNSKNLHLYLKHTLRADQAVELELQGLGSTLMEGFALGVTIAARAYPEAFGDVEDVGAREKQIGELEALRREQNRGLMSNWGLEDVTFERAYFKLGGGGIVAAGAGADDSQARALVSACLAEFPTNGRH
jgi:hypothetical protein